MRKTILAAAVGVLGLGTTAALAQSTERPAISTPAHSNVALGGYDAVSFFGEGGAREGTADYTFTHDGAEWRFASAANRDRFAENPAAFAPQYGGYCAWAVAQGYTAKGDPEYATIVAGKLYLNFSAAVHEKWRADIPRFIAEADRNWPGVLER
jgi:hypothetical protein